MPAATLTISKELKDLLFRIAEKEGFSPGTYASETLEKALEERLRKEYPEYITCLQDTSVTHKSNKSQRGKP